MASRQTLKNKAFEQSSAATHWETKHFCNVQQPCIWKTKHLNNSLQTKTFIEQIACAKSGSGGRAISSRQILQNKPFAQCLATRRCLAAKRCSNALFFWSCCWISLKCIVFSMSRGRRLLARPIRLWRMLSIQSWFWFGVSCSNDLFFKCLAACNCSNVLFFNVWRPGIAQMLCFSMSCGWTLLKWFVFHCLAAEHCSNDCFHCLAAVDCSNALFFNVWRPETAQMLCFFNVWRPDIACPPDPALAYAIYSIKDLVGGELLKCFVFQKAAVIACFSMSCC